MDKKILLLLLSIFLICLNFTSALTVSSSQSSIDVVYNVEKTLIINLTNNAAYNLYDIDIDNQYISMDAVDLNAGQTKQVTLKINSNRLGTFTESLTFIAYKRESCAIHSTTHQIELEWDSSTAHTQSICAGDKIRFVNQVGYSVHITSDFYTGDLTTASSYETPQITTLGNFPYTVSLIATSTPVTGGIITVTNDTVKVHSSTDDATFSLSIVTSLNPTSLSGDLTKESFTIEYDKNDFGYLILKNTGSESAVNVVLSGDWITFEKNNFDMSTGDEEHIKFTISPFLTSTNSTNQSYIKQLTIKADNVVEFSTSVSVFIPYAAISEGDITTPEWWKAKKQFCDAYPTSPYCATEPVIVYQKVPEYDCPAILANLSAEDVQNILRQTLVTYSSSEATMDYTKQVFNWLNLSITDICYNQYGNVSQDTSEIKKEIKDTRSIFTVLIVGLIFIVLVLAIGWTLWKDYKKKKKGHY